MGQFKDVIGHRCRDFPHAFALKYAFVTMPINIADGMGVELFVKKINFLNNLEASKLLALFCNKFPIVC